MDVFDLPRVGGNPSAAFHDQQDWRGGDDNKPLSVCAGNLPSAVHPELGLSLLYGRFFRLYRGRGWMRTDRPLLRLLLSLRHQRLSNFRSLFSVNLR